MTSRTRRQRHKYSPIHMVTAGAANSPVPADSPTAVAADKENQPPTPFSHSQLYDDHSTQPSQPSQAAQQQSSPERSQTPSRPLQLPSPPRKPNSAFTPLAPFTPLSFRDIRERPVRRQPLFSTPQPQSQSLSQQRTSAYFRPITQPLPPNPLFIPSIPAPAPSPHSPLRPTQLRSPVRPSPPFVHRAAPPPPPSSYSTEKARFLRSLPHAHRYGAIVSKLDDEEQAEEQAAIEWSEALTAPTTPPHSPSQRRGDGGSGTNDADVPATPPSVCSLASSSASSVGSFASPVSAALSAIMERDSGRRSGEGGLEEDEILTPSPDVLPGSASAAGSVPSLPASIFSSVFSQRLPLPPLTAEAKQMMVQSPLRTPTTATSTAASPPAPTSRTPTLPTLQPTAFTFAAPHLTTSTSAAGEWKGVIHIDEDRLYNATPTQSSASCSPVSASSYISASAFLSQASAASAASAASTAIPSSSPEGDAALPQLERVLAKDEADEQQQRAVLLQAEGLAPVPMTTDSVTQRAEVQAAADKSLIAELEDVPATRLRKGRRAARTPVRSTEANGAEQPAAASGHEAEMVGSAGKRRRSSRSQRSVDSLSPPASSTAVDAAQGTGGVVGEEQAAASTDSQPKRRQSARVAAAALSQPEESAPAAQAAAVAIESTRKRTKRFSKSLTPPSSAASAAIAAPASPTLASTQPGLSLSQRSHRSSSSATWQCVWCTWESPLPHMSCDMCTKARGSRPDALVEVEVRSGGRRGRQTSGGRTATAKMTASQAEATPRETEEESQQSESGENEASGNSSSARQLSETCTCTPVSQQLLQTPNSSASPSADTASTTLSQPVASPPPTHSPALSPDTLLADAHAEVDTDVAAQHQWTSTQPAVSAAWTGSRGRRRVRVGSSASGDISATQATETNGELLDTTTLHFRRRRRRHW